MFPASTQLAHGGSRRLTNTGASSRRAIRWHSTRRP